MYEHRVSEIEALDLVRGELGRERERYLAVYGTCEADTTISSVDRNSKGGAVFYMAAEAARDIGSPILVGHSPYFVNGRNGDLYLLPGRSYISGEWWNQYHYRIEQPTPAPIQTTEQVQKLIAKLGKLHAAHALYTGVGGAGLVQRRAIIEHVANGFWLTPAQREQLRPPVPRRLAAPMTEVVAPQPSHVSAAHVARAAFPVVGEFHELPYSRSDAPSIRWAVRALPAQHDAQLLTYLDTGAVLEESPVIVPDVLGAEGDVIGRLQLRTDGHWVWRSDLAFYVKHDHVAVDPRFLEHAGRRHWLCPSPAPADIERLRRALMQRLGLYQI